jgi:hypothetical protein
MARSRILWTLLLSILPLRAQNLRVYSEFARLGSDGKVVAADRADTYREILSPAIARNAYTSFQILVQLPPGTKYRLYVGENPEGATKVRVYVPSFELGVPTRLEEIRLPLETKMTDGGTAVYWMDLWADRSAKVERIKVEPQLGLEDRWVTYPMEVRVTSAVVPPHTPARVTQGGAADSAALKNIATLLCGASQPAGPAIREPKTVAELLTRNAAQDVALAATLDKDTLWLRTGAQDRQKWCKAPVRPSGAGPEWYLRVRDLMIQGK